MHNYSNILELYIQEQSSFLNQQTWKALQPLIPTKAKREKPQPCIAQNYKYSKAQNIYFQQAIFETGYDLRGNYAHFWNYAQNIYHDICHYI